MTEIHSAAHLTMPLGMKRRRDPQESDSESVNSKAQTKRSKMSGSIQISSSGEQFGQVDLKKLFKELKLARFRIYPYEQFSGWDDENLWLKVLSNIFPYHKYAPSVTELKCFIYKYYRAYEQDNDLKSFSISLSHPMKLVFAPLDDNRGQLGRSTLSPLGPQELHYNYHCMDGHMLLDPDDSQLQLRSSSRGEAESPSYRPLQVELPRSSTDQVFDALKRVLDASDFSDRDRAIIEQCTIDSVDFGDFLLKYPSEVEQYRFMKRHVALYVEKHRLDGSKLNNNVIENSKRRRDN